MCASNAGKNTVYYTQIVTLDAKLFKKENKISLNSKFFFVNGESINTVESFYRDSTKNSWFLLYSFHSEPVER